MWEAIAATGFQQTDWEIIIVLTVKKRLPHLSPTEVRHDWVFRDGLPHCQGSWLPVKQEVSGLRSQGTGESGHWQVLVKQATSTTTIKYDSYDREQNTEHHGASPGLLSFLSFIHSLIILQQTLTKCLLQESDGPLSSARGVGEAKVRKPRYHCKLFPSPDAWPWGYYLGMRRHFLMREGESLLGTRNCVQSTLWVLHERQSLPHRKNTIKELTRALCSVVTLRPIENPCTQGSWVRGPRQCTCCPY